jgi:hypothetical protein
VETGQEVQPLAEAYLPAGQPVQPEAPPQLSPVLQAGQSRQEVEAAAGWYLPKPQATHPLTISKLCRHSAADAAPGHLALHSSFMLLQPLPVPIEPPQDCELIPPGLFPKKQPKVPRQYSQVPTAGARTPANFPLGQAVQPDPKAVPEPLVMWPAGQSRQEVEAEAGWYLLTGQEVQTPEAGNCKAGNHVYLVVGTDA